MSLPPDAPEIGLASVEPAIEPFDAALRIHDALLASVKGVALAADLYPQLRPSRTGLENVPAGARHCRVEESRMDISLHYRNPCELAQAIRRRNLCWDIR